ncbi:adenosylcobinamide-GDP ribazoletransferase [Zavarzinia compransoris]|uniref:adenosylcobinamide-GDP ribazoletransferase n=1 Tax=Zavarzinia marina TaxID=2911065 RepID=UPI001F39ACAB|nr:adenosylcobinamide-GDP ribazoletransferase [Zavarzinia marina]MCF4166048.1 adenosylcobinamide-GDP ribazoletransferase [Zavarzinia marina]
MHADQPAPPTPLDEFKFVLGLFTRLPVGRPREIPAARLGRTVWCFPLVGALVGGLAALGALIGAGFGLGPWSVAIVAIAVELLVTGALHEDGFADVADSFGGRDRETRLAIMRDSRIGAFGAVALWLLLSARLVLLAGLAGAGIGAGASIGAGAGIWTLVFALIGANAAARIALLIPLVLLPPARADGLGAGLGEPPREAGGAALVYGIGIGVVCFGWGVFAVAVAVLFAGVVMAMVGRQNLGGQTGDLLGATAALSLPLVLLAVGGNG